MGKPYYDSELNLWKVELPDRTEEGSLEYVVAEYIKGGLFYKFNDGDHAHTFDGVLEKVLDNPEIFNIDGYEDQYSKQEFELIRLLLDKLKTDA